jgi:hypothetical protein
VKRCVGVDLANEELGGINSLRGGGFRGKSILRGIQVSSKYGLPSKVCQQTLQVCVVILSVSLFSSWLTSSLQYPLNTGKCWFQN